MSLLVLFFSSVVSIFNVCVVTSESTDFSQVRGSADFVDKSLFIKSILDNCEALVLAAPEGFGKSTNLDMARLFLSNTVDRKLAEEVFQGTAIIKEKDLYNTHFNSHPVIYCSFKPDCPINDHDSMVASFRWLLRRAFLQHRYLLDSPKLSKDDLTELKSYTDDEKYTQLKPSQISEGLYFLSQILQRHHEKQVILLVDDYDSVIIDSIFTKDLEIAEVLGFYNAILSRALLKNTHVNKAILAGTSCILMRPLKDMENVECAKFLQDERFAAFFGLTEAEVDELLERVPFKRFLVRRKDIAMWYDGYTCPNLTAHIYNTRSISNFLKYGELLSYWNRTGADRIFKVLMQEKITSKLFSGSSESLTIVIRELTDIDQTHLEGLKKMITQHIWDEDFSDLYIHLLVEKGFFSFDTPWERSGYNSSLTVHLPNIEICESVKQIIIELTIEAKKQSVNRYTPS